MNDNITSIQDYNKVINIIEEDLLQYYDIIRDKYNITDIEMYTEEFIDEFTTVILVQSINISQLLMDTLKKRYNILYKYITFRRTLEKIQEKSGVLLSDIVEIDVDDKTRSWLYKGVKK